MQADPKHEIMELLVQLQGHHQINREREREGQKRQYYYETKPQLTRYLYGQCSKDLLFPYVPCSWPVSFGILGCNLARSPGAVAMCAAGLSSEELPVLMIPHQVSHSALTTIINKKLLTSKKQTYSVIIKTNTDLE
jgi:hypothetical protein